MDNWLLIIVGVIFLVSIVVGYVRGFLKIMISLVSTVITIILVAFLTPYISDAIVKYTPVDEMIEERCIEAFMPEISADSLKSMDLSGTPLAGLDADQLNDINNIDWDRAGITVKDILDVIGEIPKDVQIREIQDSVLPDSLKETLLENNNNAIYDVLGVTSFPEYVASYISRMVVKLLAFLVTFILVLILVRALMAAIDLIGELPVLGFINHLGGAAAGFIVGLMIVWIGFLILTILYSTEVGRSCFEMIEKSSILKYLYETDILISKLLSF